MRFQSPIQQTSRTFTDVPEVWNQTTSAKQTWEKRAVCPFGPFGRKWAIWFLILGLEDPHRNAFVGPCSIHKI